MADALQELTNLGVSIWLDDLSRARLDSGNLVELVATRSIRGVTTNPAIFEKAISLGASDYADGLRSCVDEGLDVDATIRRLTTDDVRRACDVLAPVFEASDGADGRVSIEVDPRLAHDTEASVVQALDLRRIVDRPNVMIKVPATPEGLPAIRRLTAAGVSVNVTLIFSVERYREVAAAYMDGLRDAATAGIALSGIRSVASLFVSRVDTAVDPLLDAIGSELATELRGTAAIANARLVWDAYLEAHATPAWRELEAASANPQRPLWASMGVKDARYDDTRYVIELAVAGCVSTVPEATLEAVAEHGHPGGDTVTPNLAAAHAIWDSLEALGISRVGICDTLAQDGVQQFIDAWHRLRDTVANALAH